MSPTFSKSSISSGLLFKSDRNPSGFRCSLVEFGLCFQFARWNLVGDPSFWESSGIGPALLGRLHQPRQCIEGGTHLWQVRLISYFYNFKLSVICYLDRIHRFSHLVFPLCFYYCFFETWKSMWFLLGWALFDVKFSKISSALGL